LKYCRIQQVYQQSLQLNYWALHPLQFGDGQRLASLHPKRSAADAHAFTLDRSGSYWQGVNAMAKKQKPCTAKGSSYRAVKWGFITAKIYHIGLLFDSLLMALIALLLWGVIR